MNSTYIISAVRTPIGSFGGMFRAVSAIQLGASAIKEALIRANVIPDIVDEVFFGNVVSANLGQAPARQAAIFSGIPNTVPATAINKVCSSGLKSVMIGAQTIALGHADIVISGGMENMSQIPYYIPKARFGYKYGKAELIDGLEKDGLEDVYNHCAMGMCADQTAVKYSISREDQDAFAVASYRRSAKTTSQGIFKDEIVPLQVPQRKGDPIIVDEDEEYKKVIFDKIATLKPAFTKDGTVTAANASTINDGASALVLASEQAVKQHNLSPVARIVSFADAAHEPELFTTAPTLATPKALRRAGLSINDIDFIEINEAFAVVPLAFSQVLDVDPQKMNVHGGAVSLGHPLGASGARILTTLINVLHHKGGQRGLATICNGGGGASALVVEAV
ncbi:MAG: acetyl-CoA C-acyltransferase [Saprospiraceae bacterium]|nr:acetyl-CoA C-acyltransferase [Saprospiraceae bacterium]